MKIIKPLFTAVLITGASISLSACDMYEPTHMTENRIQVEETEFVEKIPVSELTNDYAAALAQQYERYGDGTVDLTVTYDPSSRSNTAMNASTHASRIVTTFKKNGIHDVSANILPVKGQGDDALALVTYTSYNALPPKDCSVMPGLEDTDVSPDFDYKLGCSVETVFAKQIARPKDLKGNKVGATSDGRRGANAVERHRVGIPNESLGGESSSGL